MKLRHFMKTVAAAGTAERLTESNIDVLAVSIQAETSNTGVIYVGDEEVSATDYGASLSGSDSFSASSVSLGIAPSRISLKDIWLDAGTSTDGVSVTYFSEE